MKIRGPCQGPDSNNTRRLIEQEDLLHSGVTWLLGALQFLTSSLMWFPGLASSCSYSYRGGLTYESYAPRERYSLLDTLSGDPNGFQLVIRTHEKLFLLSWSQIRHPTDQNLSYWKSDIKNVLSRSTLMWNHWRLTSHPVGCKRVRYHNFEHSNPSCNWRWRTMYHQTPS